MLAYLYKNVVQNEIHLFPTLDKALEKANEEWNYKPYCTCDIKIICTNSFRIDRVVIPSDWHVGNRLFTAYPRPILVATQVLFSETIDASRIHL